MLVGAPCEAAERYAVVISGASGGDAYTLQYDLWRSTFVSTLLKFGFADARLAVLAEKPQGAIRQATRQEVQRVMGDLARRLTKDDLLFVLLIGHGNALEGEEGKFNLVGPDLSASEWGELLEPIAGRVVFVNTTSASFPFMGKLAGPGRLVITATDSAMQQYDTIFPDFFVQAFDDPSADLDKNGRASLWEAFTSASARVRQWFEQQGRLPTERPILDDNGDGVGREAHMPGEDGLLARGIYLDAGKSATAADAAADALIKERDALEARVEALRTRRSTMPPAAYDAELERLLTELARVSLQLRAKKPS
jgi:hypothetical protein